MNKQKVNKPTSPIYKEPPVLTLQDLLDPNIIIEGKHPARTNPHLTILDILRSFNEPKENTTQNITTVLENTTLGEDSTTEDQEN